MITKQSGAVRYSVFKPWEQSFHIKTMHPARLSLPRVAVLSLPLNVDYLVCFQDTDMSYHCFDLR